MTKTQRRRTARAVRQRATDTPAAWAPLDYAAAIKLLQDPSQWKRLQDALFGLVVIEFTSPFIDTQLKCPEDARLIVHLDLLRGPTPTNTPNRRRQQPSTPDLQQRVARTLDALALLCVTAQRLSRWDDLYQSFWERVAESDAMVMPIDEPTVDKWVRFTKARGIPLLLSWSDKPFLPSQLMEPLQAFLSTPRHIDWKDTTRVNITVGLRFIQATLTTSVMEALHELLLVPSGDLDKLLVDPTCLRTLWFGSNPFYAPELNVLAAMLSDPLARRVDELKLENFIVEDSPGVSEPAFDTALSLVFSSACLLKSHDASSDTVPPLSLSLAKNTLFTEHLEAFREAIALSARPVRALSLAEVYIRTEDAWKSLTDLVFCPLPTATPCAVLDLTGVSSPTRYSLGLSFLVRNFVESFWSTGVIDTESVECCVHNATVLFLAPDGTAEMDTAVPPHTFLTVEDYNPGMHYLKVSLPDPLIQGDSERITGWVSIANITQLRHNNSVVVGTSFRRLIYDGQSRFDHYTRETLLQLTTAMGSELHSLAVERLQYRWWRPIRLSEIIGNCPQLRELSLERSYLTKVGGAANLWDAPDFQLPSTLEILNLSYCGLRDASLQRLHNLRLRYLSLLGNPVGAVGVESLLAMLRTNKELKTVELNQQYSNPPSQCMDLNTQIDALLGREYLQARDKAAVLSVLAHLQQHNPRLPFPGNDVVALVFAFVGTKPSRVAKWYY